MIKVILLSSNVTIAGCGMFELCLSPFSQLMMAPRVLQDTGSVILVSVLWIVYFTHCSRTNAENVSPTFYHVNRILYSNISIIISGSSYNGSGCRGLWPPLLYCNSLMAHCYIYWERKSTIENSPVSGIVQLCYSPLSTIQSKYT